MTAEAQIKFIPNQGQWNGPFQFRADIPGGYMFLRPQGIMYDFLDQKALQEIHHHPLQPAIVNAHAMELLWAGASSIGAWEPQNQSSTYYNYYLGKDPARWKTGLHSSTQIKLKQLYPGIDAVLDAEDQVVKYTYYVAAGTDPKKIRMVFRGARSLQLSDQNLTIKTSVNQIQEQAPYAYQMLSGTKKEVACNFQLRGDTVSFYFPRGYNKSLPLVIDPTVVFISYSGSTADNWGFTATYDTAGNAYGGGTVYDEGYPTDTGSYQRHYNPNNQNADRVVSEGLPRDIGIMKLSADGTQLLYATYLGGSFNEEPQSMVVDSNNNLIVFGTTLSTDFPVTAKAYDTSQNGSMDIFLSKFSPDGRVLKGSTYMGGKAADGLNGLTVNDTTLIFNVEYTVPLAHNYGDQMRGEVIVDPKGNIIVGTSTYSTDFPVSSNAYQKTIGGKLDACVFEMDSTLGKLNWSTYVGDTSNDAAYSVQIDQKNNVYLCGGTQSAYFFSYSSAYQKSLKGNVDGYVCKLKDDGSGLLAATYIGTHAYDQAYFVQLDKNQNVYLYGQTLGSDSFPIKNAAFSNANSGQFIVKFDNSLQHLMVSSLFGSGDYWINISPSAFLVDQCGKIYVCGWGGYVNADYAKGNTKNMPITKNAYQTTTDGSDFYVGVFAPDMDTLLYGSYFGGNGSIEHVDGGTSRFDKRGVIYQSVCGGCGGDSHFKTTPNAWSTTNKSSNCNNLVFKVDLQLPVIRADFSISPQSCQATALDITNTSKRANSYLWFFGDGTTDTAKTPTHQYKAPGTYTISLVITNLNGCNEHDTVKHNVVVYSTADINYTIDHTPCSPTVNINNKGTTSNYQWDFGDGYTSRLYSPSHTYTKSGRYTIRVIADSGSYCEKRDSQQVDVYFTKANFTTIYDSCTGKLKLVNLSQFADKYLWRYGNGDTSTQKSLQINISDATNLNIQLTAMDSAGCSDSMSMSQQFPSPPTADFDAYPYPCSGIVFTSNQSKSATSYFWDFGDGTTTTEATPQHTYKKSGKYIITLTVNPNGKCPVHTSKTYDIYFPTAHFNYQPDTCGLGVSFYDSSEGAVNSYTWSIDTNVFSHDKNPRYVFPASGAYHVRLVIKDTAGCSDTLSQSVNVSFGRFARFTVNVNPCNRAATFNNVSKGAFSYAWNFGDGSSSSDKSPRHTYADTGTYTVTLVINPGSACADTIQRKVVIAPVPIAAFDHVMDTCTGIVQFINHSLYSHKYRWDYGDSDSISNISHDANPQHLYTTPGLHRIRLIADSGTACADTAYAQVEIPTAYTEPFKIYNVFTPNNDGINDVFAVHGLKHCSNYILEIYNRWGELVYRTSGNRLEWNGNTQNNAKPMPPAVYFYVLKFSDKEIIRGAVTLVR